MVSQCGSGTSDVTLNLVTTDLPMRCVFYMYNNEAMVSYCRGATGHVGVNLTLVYFSKTINLPMCGVFYNNEAMISNCKSRTGHFGVNLALILFPVTIDLPMPCVF